MSEKQRLKLEKFANKREKQAQQAQQMRTNDSSKKSKFGKQSAPVARSEDWVEETPAGQKKIMKPLDSDFHRAYMPRVVESAWYNFWEEQGLFRPQTCGDGKLRARGKYVIAIPPPNVCINDSFSATPPTDTDHRSLGSFISVMLLHYLSKIHLFDGTGCGSSLHCTSPAVTTPGSRLKLSSRKSSHDNL